MTDSGKIDELGRFDLEGDADAAAATRCTVQNDSRFKARVVFMAHRNGELWEHRVYIRPGQTVTIACPLGQVVVVVFNVETNSFHQGRVLRVGGPFTFVVN